jgi:quinol monooxygenase YgiN
MVRLSITLTAPSARAAQELLDALRFLMSSTRLEPGCLGCSAWTSRELKVSYTEDWVTEADVRRRVRSEPFTSLLEIVELGKDPCVQFDFIASTRGLDYVAEVRGGRGD